MTDLLTTLLLALAAVTLGTLRVSGVTSPAFQALAHLLVGGLIAAALVSRAWQRWSGHTAWRIGAGWRLYATLAAGLTAVEVACFLLGIGR